MSNFDEMSYETHSKMEIAMTYIAEHEGLNDLPSDAFQAFWENPLEVIKLHKKMLEMMRVRFQFTDEMIETYCKDYLLDACNEYVNLNTDTPAI